MTTRLSASAARVHLLPQRQRQRRGFSEEQHRLDRSQRATFSSHCVQPWHLRWRLTKPGRILRRCLHDRVVGLLRGRYGWVQHGTVRSRTLLN